MNRREQIIKAAITTLEGMRPTEWVPNPVTRAVGLSTGNMAFNSLQYEVMKTQMVIRINEDIAPYFPYTEYPWKAERKNPNEGWVERFVIGFYGGLAYELGGYVSD